MRPKRFTPDDVARWLLDALESAGTLDREFHVRQVASWFGAEFSAPGDDGLPTFAPPVLEALDRLASNRVVWDQAQLAWRLRAADEPPSNTPPAASAPTLVWHHRYWSSIMISTLHHQCLVYRRGDLVSAAERIALRVSGREYDWTEAGRQDFAGTGAPATIYVEITAGTKRKRYTSIYAYHQPEGRCPPHSTPASRQAGNLRRQHQPSYAKLIFRFAAESADRKDAEVERMWVLVTALDEDENYIGTLDNDPVHNDVLTCGDAIHFHPLHVMEVLTESNEGRQAMADAEKTAREYIERYVRFGFYRSADVEKIVGEDVLGGELSRKRIRELVKAEMARQNAEQKSWPKVTDCDRLDEAFVALRAEGVVAIHNAGYTPSEGIDEMSEQYHAAGGKKSGIVGYCFYHRQDMEYALKQRKLGLAYGAIDGDAERGVEVGQRICSALEAAGLRVTWTGSIKDKMDITKFNWRRRSKAGRTRRSP